MAALRYSIRVKIFVFTILVNLLLVACYTGYLYHTNEKALNDKITAKLSAVAETLRISTDEYHKKIENNASITSEEYNKVMGELSRLAENVGVEYIYTLVARDQKAYYTADSYTKEDLKQGRITKFFEIYQDAPKGVFDAVKTKKPVFEDYSDSYGKHRSIFLPVTVGDDDAKTYIIGIDISIGDIDAAVAEIIQNSIIYALFSLLFALAMSYIMYNPMLYSIVELSGITKEVARGNFSARSSVVRKDEIGDLSESINHMIVSLGELVENIEEKVEERTETLSKAMTEVKELHKSVRDSIEYASMIQSALIPTFDILKPYFSDCFSIWQPKDTVSGDIYMFESFMDRHSCLIFVIDCTGHGVPGAFVTMLVKAIERNIISHIGAHPDKEISPAHILAVFNRSIRHLLKQDEKESCSNAGFDGTIFYYNKQDKIVKFASSQNHVLLMRGEEPIWYKGDRQSVGYKHSDPNYVFTEQVIEVQKGDFFFLSTDGLYDQNGGEKDIPLGRRKIEKLLVEYAGEPLNEIKELILCELGAYQGSNPRNDDVSFVGLKI